MSIFGPMLVVGAVLAGLALLLALVPNILDRLPKRKRSPIQSHTLSGGSDEDFAENAKRREGLLAGNLLPSLPPAGGDTVADEAPPADRRPSAEP